ncbi:hypothetical protein [Thermoplasma volcanium GSS1]|uniref:Major facilitator superfamily (MFS) profile domain-containing protein n=1 Tax=Thermoplasma volcanium (strain ATCC 51530 / DSM 4299 / JCM 9571 / NBRC 15438 / GSS1) TaxID=273116 RepID=Q978K5_THEVO|nr:hypothetical protein [Thermoplasma volcanium]BAB60552.1 hypothetical protein [Thermoplasma volcanium GSS1]
MRNITENDRIFLIEFSIVLLTFFSLSVYAGSFTFVLIEGSIPLYYLGVYFSVAIIFYLAFNPVSYEYVKRYGDLFSVPISILVLSVAFIIIYISQGAVSITASLIIFTISFTVFYNSTVKNGYRRDINESSFIISSGIGILLGLLVSAFFGGVVSDLYSYVSILLLMIGLITIILFTKKTNSKPEKMDILYIFMRPFYSMDKVRKADKKLLLLADSLDEIFLWLAIGASFPFLIAAGIGSGLSHSAVMISIATASFVAAVAVYLYLSMQLPIMSFYYLSKDVLLIVGLLLMSFMSPPSYFASLAFLSFFPAAFIGSEKFLKSQFPADLNYREITAFFRNPIMVISPLMGSILWIVGRHMLFLISVGFAVMALVTGILVITNPRLFKLSGAEREKDPL